MIIWILDFEIFDWENYGFYEKKKFRNQSYFGFADM